jgi:hypothetical protein
MYENRLKMFWWRAVSFLKNLQGLWYHCLDGILTVPLLGRNVDGTSAGTQCWRYQCWDGMLKVPVLGRNIDGISVVTECWRYQCWDGMLTGPVLGRNVDGTGLKLIVRWTNLSTRCLVTRARNVSAGNGKLAPRYGEFLRFGRACVEHWWRPGTFKPELFL